MAEPPKPFPRTKLRSAPVRILIENDELSSDAKVNTRPRPSVPNFLTPELVLHNEPKNSTKDLSTVISIPDDTVVDESSKKNSLQGETPDSKTNLTTEPIKDTAGKSNIVEQIDEDDVVDKILGLKPETSDRKIVDKDGSPVGSAKSAKSDNGSAAVKEPPNNDSSSEINEDLLAIHIHRSDCLKMDRIIRHPSVAVHIVDAEKKGEYLQKTQPNKNVTYNQEQSNFILPVLTRPFNFKDRQSIIPEWEEIITFNENTSHIIKPSTILFFEIVDFVDASHSDAENASVGWHRIAWAFLRPNKSTNFSKILRLQLYKANPKITSLSTGNVSNVYNWFRSRTRKPYPSTLYVTVKSISSCKVDSKPQQRSCTPLQPEVGSEASVKSLGVFSSDGEDDCKNGEHVSAIYRLSNIEWSRLPGQSCHIPNSKIASLYPDPKGSLVVKFSHSGIFLACGTSSDLIIYAIDGVLERRLVGHQGLIYTLCWYTDDSLLISASADCTVCVWDMKSASEIPLQILPHPSFVYCGTFLFPESTIITGCYDGMIRIWWQTHASSRFWQLNQELTGHEVYVNAICPFRSREFFSGDSVGVIIHWAADEYGRWFKLNVVKLSEIHGIIINKLIPFPGNKRLLIHTRDSLLRTMDIKTSVVIQWYQGGLNDSSQCNSTITPCGSYIFSISEDGTVNVWESNTGKQMAFYSSETSTIGCGGSIDYHPFDHVSAFSFYSSNYNSSTVLLLKYTRNKISTSDVMLYTLNENMTFS